MFPIRFVFTIHCSMEWALVKCLVLVLMVFLQIHGRKCCVQEERMGLLEFKAFLKSNGADADRLLPSWVDDDRESDCCAWERVTCNATTGHVMDLALNNTKQVSLSYSDSTVWFLNVSLFQPFKELRSLDLSSNGFSAATDNEDVENLSRLKKLETLDLRSNSFNKSIIPSLSALPSLKNLILAENVLGPTFPVQELSTLENLELLDVSRNAFRGPLTENSQSLSKLAKLKHLDLSLNFISTESLKELATLSSLEVFLFRENFLIGMLPLQGLCELNKLQELDLSSSFLYGILPPCLNNLTSLRVLDLSENQFIGTISSIPISNLTSLEYIDLSHNSFKGSFSFSSFGNHSKLEVVSFMSDNNEFEVETELSSWVPMFQLKVLVLSNCNLNKLNGDIPKFLLNQNELKIVDLSHNNLTGKFPNWLFKNNTQLGHLNLRNNSFVGQLHLPPYPNINVRWIDVSVNQVGGQLQENIGEVFPYITYLNLSKNAFEGSMPGSICGMSGLRELDLSANNFSGEVPKQLVAGCISLLGVLKLSNNNFHGQIFLEHFNLPQIWGLYLDNNKFTGNISSVISGSSFLSVLDISDNFMSGEIHGWMANMANLRKLVMRNNSFKGPFPFELVPVIQFLDLSHNSFSGSLPCCSNLQNLKYIYLQGNKFTGPIPQAILNSSNLLILDTSDNFLSGSIPDLIGGLSDLRVLALGGNNLSGLIPHQLCQLNKIGLMDLSENSFSGSIPHCFNNINFGNTEDTDGGFTREIGSFETYGSPPQKDFSFKDREIVYEELGEAEFVTKYIALTYEGDILNYMSGLDLSCNNLTGEIPDELGGLSRIHALNLSHNQLTGYIPSAFSNLTQIESLDLSYNNLSGQIPSELINLNFLSAFMVAHNNLSGRLPDMKAQFGTFENSSYDGNPFLCGPPLEKKCTPIVESPHPPPTSLDESERKWYDIDRVVFYASFAASYIIFLLGVAALLYLNPHWQQRWFNFVEECFYSCYYFVYDTLYKLSACFRN